MALNEHHIKGSQAKEGLPTRDDASKRASVGLDQLKDKTGGSTRVPEVGTQGPRSLDTSEVSSKMDKPSTAACRDALSSASHEDSATLA